jgi:hypothetical protein
VTEAFSDIIYIFSGGGGWSPIKNTTDRYRHWAGKKTTSSDWLLFLSHEVFIAVLVLDEFNETLRNVFRMPSSSLMFPRGSELKIVLINLIGFCWKVAQNFYLHLLRIFTLRVYFHSWPSKETARNRINKFSSRVYLFFVVESNMNRVAWNLRSIVNQPVCTEQEVNQSNGD